VHDPRGAPPDTPLYADGLVNDFHGIFGLWRIDGYDRILQALMHRFELSTDPLFRPPKSQAFAGPVARAL
jgi:hypothetical protein